MSSGKRLGVGGELTQKTSSPLRSSARRQPAQDYAAMAGRRPSRPSPTGPPRSAKRNRQNPHRAQPLPSVAQESAQPFQTGEYFWIPTSEITRTTTRQRRPQRRLAALITLSTPEYTTWTWIHDPHVPQRRPTQCLQAQSIRPITAEERAHLLLDPNFTLANVVYRIHHN